MELYEVQTEERQVVYFVKHQILLNHTHHTIEMANYNKSNKSQAKASNIKSSNIHRKTFQVLKFNSHSITDTLNESAKKLGYKQQNTNQLFSRCNLEFIFIRSSIRLTSVSKEPVTRLQRNQTKLQQTNNLLISQ